MKKKEALHIVESKKIFLSSDSKQQLLEQINQEIIEELKKEGIEKEKNHNVVTINVKNQVKNRENLDNYFFKNETNETRFKQLPIEKSKQILIILLRFEQNQEYLKPNITISNLASKLNTNSKYLSKTINIILPIFKTAT
ncbi:hypothetical protein [Aquimarina sp. I32.4]|uniref:hypothetical protein n=1 Tax=Aquimarina sp. I32.4 TaxID=2053903 RepID=UPI000CDE7110|nr:hypothetical protein [Aquimarina sp. I32.4]